MLVLASNSPRRKQLLALGGWTFSVLPVEIDEQPISGESPEEYVLRLAEGKAQVAARQAPPDALIIAADTTVVDQGQILGKPADSLEAEVMLRRLRGRTHQVHTALCIQRLQDGALHSEICTTDVSMRNYSEEEMLAYIASGDPLDKAGAYAIQHIAFDPVESLQGCYTNVVGLPLCRVMQMLAKFGVSPEVELPLACLHTLEGCSERRECSITPEVLARQF